MDQAKMREAARTFDDLLQKYGAVDGEARLLRDAMGGLIADALSGKITEPLDTRRVSGRLFDEGHLRQYRDLEEAFVDFKIEVTGGEDSPLS